LILNATDESQVEDALIHQNIHNGGKWKPTNCVPSHHTAILIPFRNREDHLLQFLINMHPILSRQKISYSIYLIEPIADIKFNRALLLNIGFIEANRDSNDEWDCYVLHDVDLLPEDDRNMYTCEGSAFHLSRRIDVFNYRY
jgi:hypothetical protein